MKETTESVKLEYLWQGEASPGGLPRKAVHLLPDSDSPFL